MKTSFHIFSIGRMYNLNKQKPLLNNELLNDYFELQDWIRALREKYALQTVEPASS